MSTHRKLEIDEWNASKEPTVPKPRVSKRFWTPGVIGLAGTLLLHGLAIQTAVFGNLVHRVHPPPIRALGSPQSKSAPEERLLFVDIPNLANARTVIDQPMASALAALATNPVRVSVTDFSTPLNAFPPIDDEARESSDPGDGGAEHRRLLGIYSGQIQARVERIWSRPRTGINEGAISAKVLGAVEYFHCLAQIVQDSMGNVQEVLLPDCNGTSAWQRSLVVAIQRASPLPAPPSPSVFNSTIAINFIGYPYVPGASDEGYETSRVETPQLPTPAKTAEQVAHVFLPFRPNAQPPAH